MFGRGSDPSYGIRYNKMHDNYRVSRYKYSFDIAHTPRVVKDDGDGFLFIDVQDRCHRVNDKRYKIEYKASRVEGRF